MKYILLFTALFISTFIKSQCFEIQSILVDACDGPNEGQNEMVIFKVGATALNTSALTVSWPANTWRGLCQNASTAADVATVNATIVNCGFLKEPVGGVLPANSKVLLIAGTSWNPIAQSFVNLSDTLYVIFQCYNSGNVSGHFANYLASGGLRTLSMTFSSPPSCTDVVTYNRALLIQQNGTTGAQDGGAVEFTAAGVATYVNHGCQAPYTPLTVDAGINQTICVGGTQSFTATTSGAFTTVNWSLGAGATGSFAPTNSLTTTYTAGSSDNGTIKLYCTVIKSCSTQTTTVKDSVNLTLTPAPTVTISPTVVNICAGQTATLQANTNTASTYTWTGTGITGLHTNTVSVNTVGVYTVNVSNACGSNSATVSVNLLSSPSITATSSSPTLCASGQTATLSLSGSTGTYLWSNGSSTATTTINAPGIYTATVTTSSCGTATASISIGTAPNPTISISTPTTTICAGSSVILTANSNTTNYLWTGGATTQTLSATTNSVVVTTTNSCGSASASQSITIIPLPTLTVSPNAITLCNNQTATLQATSNTAVTYNWLPGGATTNTLQVNAAGVYTLNVSNQCGLATATATVTISATMPTPTIVATSTLLCTGQTTTLSINGATGTYIWSTGSTSPTISISNFGVYSATVTNSCGNASSFISITSSPTPTVSLTPQSSILCPGFTGTLTATSNVNNYLWNTGVTTNTLSYTNAGVYTVTVSTANCGIATASANVSSINFPPLVITSSSNTLCPNETATLTVNGGVPLTTGSPILYAWSNSTSTASVVTTNGGTVTVSNTNVCGTQTQTIIVTVDPLNAAIVANPQSGIKPLVVNFTDNSFGANGFNWNFGNGNTANTQNVSSQTYTAAGTYTVVLTVTNANCTDNDYVIITVLNEEADLLIPNVFTPNNDGKNDVFKITANSITDFNCVIFDRWGLKLFTWTDAGQGWDGKVGGSNCTDGTYFFILNAKDLNGKEIKKQGSFSLFR